jgi:hypothetical protein
MLSRFPIQASNISVASVTAVSFHPPAPERSKKMFTCVVETYEQTKQVQTSAAVGIFVLLYIHQSWFREDR